MEILKEELDYACDGMPAIRIIFSIGRWIIDPLARIADLPFLPVGCLKANPPLSLVGRDEIKRTLTSSATTSQLPSRVVLDSPTARRMTKGMVAIIRDFIGPARRPYLVVDTPGFMEAETRRERRGDSRAAAFCQRDDLLS